MDKEKQVIEMAKILCPKGTANCEKCSKNYKCDVKFSQLAELFDGGCRIVGDDEIVIKKSKHENKEIDSFLRGRESAFYDIESFYNIPKKDIDCIKTIDKAKQEAKREILKELNDEGYKIYKQQGNTFDAGNFNWLIAYTMRKHGIDLEDNNE